MAASSKYIHTSYRLSVILLLVLKSTPAASPFVFALYHSDAVDPLRAGDTDKRMSSVPGEV